MRLIIGTIFILIVIVLSVNNENQSLKNNTTNIVKDSLTINK